MTTVVLAGGWVAGAGGRIVQRWRQFPSTCSFCDDRLRDHGYVNILVATSTSLEEIISMEKTASDRRLFSAPEQG